MEASKFNFWQYLNRVIKRNFIDFEIGKKYFYYQGFQFNIRGKLRNPIVGNILIALYEEFLLILRSEKIVFVISCFYLILGGSFEIQFLAIF